MANLNAKAGSDSGPVPAYIDSHAHVDGDRFDADRETVIQRARDNGVGIIMEICNGDVAEGSLERGVELAETYPFIYGAVGIHPHDAKLWNDEMESRLIRLAKRDKIIAWGEVGLDYHYNHSAPDVQRSVFRRQLELAAELDLPVVIHSREAERETTAILLEVLGRQSRGGIIHCFGGDQQMAEESIDLGFMISFAGNVTFKKATALREVARNLPLDRILIETDCPFMTPEPFRGRRNEPCYVREVARQCCELKGLSTEEVGRITSRNFLKFYGLTWPVAESANEEVN